MDRLKAYDAGKMFEQAAQEEALTPAELRGPMGLAALSLAAEHNPYSRIGLTPPMQQASYPANSGDLPFLTKSDIEELRLNGRQRADYDYNGYVDGTDYDDSLMTKGE